MSVTAMTQTEMVAEVANIIGRDSTSISADGTTAYSTRIKQWLYWSHLTMARIYAFPELDVDPVSYSHSTSTNIRTFTALGLSRVRQILSVTLEDGTSSRKLTQLLPRRFQQDYPIVSSDLRTGRMEDYTIYGNRLEFWPLGDATYTLSIRYNQYPDNFPSASDASVYTYKDDVIIAGAVAHAYVSLQETEDAKYWANVFAGRMSTAIGPVNDPADWAPEGRAFDSATGGSTMTNLEANPLIYFNP